MSATKRKWGKQASRTWTKFEWATLTPTSDPAMAKLVESGLVRIAMNNLYQVQVYQGEAVPCTAMAPGSVVYLSIRRLERARLPRDWRDLQRIKNEIVGPEHEGFELFPAESRLCDQADQFHLWVLARPMYRDEDGTFHATMGVGWTVRDVADHGEAEKGGGSQRPLPPGPAFHTPPLLTRVWNLIPSDGPEEEQA